MYVASAQDWNDARRAVVQFPDVQQICRSFVAAPANSRLESSTAGHLTGYQGTKGRPPVPNRLFF